MKFKLDPTSSVPLYQQAEEILRKLIDLDEYKQNSKLFPSEVELAQQLNISRNTLRQAINKLVFEGHLIRKKGFGTRVAKKSMLIGAKNWLSFTQEMRSLGIEVHNFELHVEWKIPPDEVAAFFNIDSKVKVLCLERLRGKKDLPFVSFISYFNPAIPLTGNENFTRQLYEILEKDYNIIVTTSKEEVSASLAGKRGEKLEISMEDPILIRKRFVYDMNNLPVEFNIGYYRADSFTYTIESHRK